MRPRPLGLRQLAALLAGAAFFAALPVYAPPIVLQSEEVPRFLTGLAAAAVAGVVLNLASGYRGLAGVPPVMVCAFVGVLLYTFAYAVPKYGTEGQVLVVAVGLPVWTFSCYGVPAAIGAGLAGLARGLADRIGRGRGRARRAPR